MKEVFREEGVSEVVGTILVLAITVALFGTVFVYVQHVPPPSEAPSAVIFPSVRISDGHLYLNISDKGGSTFISNDTFLFVYVNGQIHSFLLFELTGKPTFGPGDTLYLNGSQPNSISVTSNSSLYFILFSKQYNSIVWKSQNFVGSELAIGGGYATATPVNAPPFIVRITNFTFPINVTITNVTIHGHWIRITNVTITNGTIHGHKNGYKIQIGRFSNITFSTNATITNVTIPGNITMNITIFAYVYSLQTPKVYVNLASSFPNINSNSSGGYNFTMQQLYSNGNLRTFYYTFNYTFNINQDSMLNSSLLPSNATAIIWANIGNSSVNMSIPLNGINADMPIVESI